MDRDTRISTALSIIAICISLFSAYSSYQQGELVNEQNRLMEDINYLNINPEVLSYFYYPNPSLSFRSPDDQMRKEINSEISPVLAVKNNAPINVVSFSVKCEVLYFSKNENAVIQVSQNANSYFDDLGDSYLIFRKILNSNEYVMSPPIIDNNLTDESIIQVYVFYMEYYRESDMKHYSKRDIYFVDNSDVYLQEHFKNNVYYKPIMEQIDRWSVDFANFLKGPIYTYPDDDPYDIIFTRSGNQSNQNDSSGDITREIS